MKKKILMVFVMTPFIFFGSCKSPVVPDNPEPVIKYVDVEVKYQRVNDTPNCPIVRPENKEVLLRKNLPVEYPNNKLQEVEENLFYIKVINVTVNYPSSDYNIYTRNPYTVFVIDNAFWKFGVTPDYCAHRAHLLWLNGKLMEKMKRGGEIGEYVLVRVDEYGNFYEVDR